MFSSATLTLRTADRNRFNAALILHVHLGQEWRAKGERGEVPRLLRRLQSIRVGTLRVAGHVVRRLLTQSPAELTALLDRLGLLPLVGQPPPWAQA